MTSGCIDAYSLIREAKVYTVKTVRGAEEAEEQLDMQMTSCP